MGTEPPLFVYGTLRDPEIRAALLERELGADAVKPARARGFRAVYVPGATYPALVSAPASTAPGLALYGLTEAELAILDVYEGTEYRRDVIAVTIEAMPARARAYLPAIPIPEKARGWTFEEWNRRHRRSVFHKEAALADKSVPGGENV